MKCNQTEKKSVFIATNWLSFKNLFRYICTNLTRSKHVENIKRVIYKFKNEKKIRSGISDLFLTFIFNLITLRLLLLNYCLYIGTYEFQLII